MTSQSIRTEKAAARSVRHHLLRISITDHRSSFFDHQLLVANILSERGGETPEEPTAKQQTRTRTHKADYIILPQP